MSKQGEGETKKVGTNRIKTLDELREIRATLKEQGQEVVWTNGCFDILHIGHVRYLQQAKELGDVLFLGLNGDDSVRQLKGEGRPHTPEQERAEILSALEPVDYVLIFPEINTDPYLTQLQPDIYAKGGDYTVDSIVKSERKIIESYGGRIEIIPVDTNISTTKIVESIKQK